jgi:hypothetical protein
LTPWLHLDFSKKFRSSPMVERRRTGVDGARLRQLQCPHHEPSTSNQAIWLEPNLTETELSKSAVTRNGLLLLRRAIETGGLKLTKTGSPRSDP